MQKRKHHYVPQFYLREFLDTRVEHPKEPYIWVYDKKEKNLKRKGTSNVAFQNGFYDMKLIDGSITPIIENFFSKNIENSASLVFKKIINQIPINIEERLMFSNFLYFTLARVPNFLNYMSWFYKNGDLIIDEKLVSSDVEKIIENTSFSKEVSTLEFMIEMSQIFASIISEMNWQFLIAPEGKNFVTSDNPLILNDPSLIKIAPSFMGWNNPNIHLTFPLSPKLCMKATWKKKRKTYIKADVRFLRAINFRTSFFATRFIFSSRPIEPPPINCAFIYNVVDTYDSQQ